MNLDFERNETLRQSVRIKKKAPLPPVVPAEYRAQRNQVIKAQSFSSYTRPGMGNRVRDFVRPVVVSAVKKTTIQDDTGDDDHSMMALRDIQRQINEIEYFSHHPKEVIPVQNERKFPEVNKTRYDEMESLLNTGISDVAPEGGFQYLASKQDDTTDDEEQKFHRGSTSRSTTGAVLITPSGTRQISQVAINAKLKSQRPATRTASDSKPSETINPAVSRYRDILNQHRTRQPTVMAPLPQFTKIIVPPPKVNNIHDVVDINTQITNPTTKSHHLINNKRTVARETTDQVTNTLLHLLLPYLRLCTSGCYHIYYSFLVSLLFLYQQQKLPLFISLSLLTLLLLSLNLNRKKTSFHCLLSLNYQIYNNKRKRRCFEVVKSKHTLLTNTRVIIY